MFLYKEFLYRGKSFKFCFESPNDAIYKYAWRLNAFYEGQLLYDLSKMEISGVYVDVGAHYGNHSVFFANFCPSTSIVSVELSPENFEVLKENCHLNIRDKKVVLFNNAIVDRSRMVNYGERLETCTSGVRVEENENGNIEGITLDEVLNNIEDIAVIKMDIEGYEYQALLGANKTFEKSPKLWITEVLSHDAIKEQCKLMYSKNYKVLKQYSVFGMNQFPSMLLWVKK